MPDLEEILQQNLFQDRVFARLELPGIEVPDKEFTGCTFRNLKAEASVWRRSRFEDCVFEDCDLTRAQFSQARFHGVMFRRSKLMGIDWSSLAPNPTVTFDECDLRYTSFVKVNLRKTVIRACKALDSNFIECQLAESDFSASDLGGANFEGSDLTKANLATTLNAFVSPAKNRVKGARISVEAAVLIAISHGMKVAGYPEPPSLADHLKR